MRARRTPSSHFALLCLGFVLTTPWQALAYIDPGTGSYLFQLAAAGLLAGMFTVRRYWDALKSALRWRSNGSGSNQPSSE
jgi:hypothetical protein